MNELDEQIKRIEQAIQANANDPELLKTLQADRIGLMRKREELKEKQKPNRK